MAARSDPYHPTFLGAREMYEIGVHRDHSDYFPTILESVKELEGAFPQSFQSTQTRSNLDLIEDPFHIKI